MKFLSTQNYFLNSLYHGGNVRGVVVKLSFQHLSNIRGEFVHHHDQNKNTQADDAKSNYAISIIKIKWKWSFGDLTAPPDNN